MRWLILPFVLALAACDNPLSPEQRIAGTYDLESINATPLPYEIFGVLITSGSLEMRSEGTFTARTTTTYEDWETGQLVTENSVDNGRFTITDDRVRLTDDDGEQTDATFDGRIIRIDAGIITAVYRKR